MATTLAYPRQPDYPPISQPYQTPHYIDPSRYDQATPRQAALGPPRYVPALTYPMASEPSDPLQLPPAPSSQWPPEDLPTSQDRRSTQSGSKRRRAPNWDTFYKNGLPREVIVVHDTPTPPPAKRRRASPPEKTGLYAPQLNLEAGPALYAPYLGSATNTTAPSTDRTTSAFQTTAETSLGSVNSQNEPLSKPVTRKRAAAGPKKPKAAVPRTRRTKQQIEADKAAAAAAAAVHALAHYHAPPFPPRTAPDLKVPIIRPPAYSANEEVDDKEGHYLVQPETVLGNRYRIVQLLGQGTFGKVVEAEDRHTRQVRAIKIIRAVPKYRDASKIELRVLETLRLNDPNNENKCIHLRDVFDYRNHICIVTDLLSSSIFDFLKENSFTPFPSSQIQDFARQLLTSVAYLHDLNLIHTDLKPENILLEDNRYQTFTYNRVVPSSTSVPKKQPSTRRVLLNTGMRLIDFGSATFDNEYHSQVVSTRHYRAPEIILGLGWSFPCDIWSIGCILIEFFTGDALFQTHDNLEHLAMMEAVIGRVIEPKLVRKVVAAKGNTRRDREEKPADYFKRTKLNYPKDDTTRSSRKYVRAMKKVDEIVLHRDPFSSLFLDLLKKILVYDPDLRLSAKECLQHPWFQERIDDDGTECLRLAAQASLPNTIFVADDEEP